MKGSVTRKDLDILGTHVRALRARTERICRDHITELQSEPRIEAPVSGALPASSPSPMPVRTARYGTRCA